MLSIWNSPKKLSFGKGLSQFKKNLYFSLIEVLASYTSLLILFPGKQDQSSYQKRGPLNSSYVHLPYFPNKIALPYSSSPLQKNP